MPADDDRPNTLPDARTRMAALGGFGPKPLTDRELRFVEAYLADPRAGPAAAAAGYNAASGYKLLRGERIRRAIRSAMAERARRVRVDSDQVVAELASVAFSSVADAADWGFTAEGEPWLHITPRALLPASVSRAISEISFSPLGLKVKMHDKMHALELLARHLGMILNRLETSQAAPRPTEKQVFESEVQILARFFEGTPQALRDEMRGLIMRMQAAKASAGAD